MHIGMINLFMPPVGKIGLTIIWHRFLTLLMLRLLLPKAQGPKDF